jgi:hypothetical protein
MGRGGVGMAHLRRMKHKLAWLLDHLVAAVIIFGSLVFAALVGWFFQ